MIPAMETAYGTVAAALFDEPSTEDLFNPYSGRVPGLDRPDAAATRRVAGPGESAIDLVEGRRTSRFGHGGMRHLPF